MSEVNNNDEPVIDVIATSTEGSVIQQSFPYSTTSTEIFMDLEPWLKRLGIEADQPSLEHFFDAVKDGYEFYLKRTIEVEKSQKLGITGASAGMEMDVEGGARLEGNVRRAPEYEKIIRIEKSKMGLKKRDDKE